MEDSQPNHPNLDDYPVCPRCQEQWSKSTLTNTYAFCRPCDVEFDFGDSIYWHLPDSMSDLFPPADGVSCWWNFEEMTTTIYHDINPNWHYKSERPKYWEYKFHWLPFDLDKERLQKLILLA